MENFRQGLDRRWVRALLTLLSWALLLTAWLNLGLVGLVLWQGGTWAYGIYENSPLVRLTTAAVAFLGWYILRHGPTNTRPDWLRFVGRTVLLTVSVACAVAVGEVGLRQYFIWQQDHNSLERLERLRKAGKPLPIRSTHPMAVIIQTSLNRQLVYELQPGLNMDFGHKTLRINQAGMRDSRDYPLARTPHSVRIVGIGDSGMFGWGLDQDENYLDVLESNLCARADGVRYEVLNLAVPGYNSQLEVECLHSKGLAYQPDVVIVGWGENDYQLPFFLRDRREDARRDISYLYTLLFDRARLQELMPNDVIHDLRGADLTKASPELISGADIAGVERAMRDLQRMSATNGFRVLVFGPMGEPVRDICHRVGLPYYNTYEKIPEGQYPAEYAVHFMHPRPGGHRVLAEHLERDLQERGWLQPRP